MRRADKEITDPELISWIIRNGDVCRLAVAKDNVPYIIPISYGYDGSALYLHTAMTGAKIEFFEANQRVCFEFEQGVQVKPNETRACGWTFTYRSVIGHGTIHELTDPGEMIAALHHIMKQYSEREWSFSEENLAGIRVWKVNIESLTGKQSKDLAG